MAFFTISDQTQAFYLHNLLAIRIILYLNSKLVNEQGFFDPANEHSQPFTNAKTE